MDQRFLYCKHAPIVSPLLKPMWIELYNDKWLQPHGNDLNTKYAHKNLPSSKLDSVTFEPHISTFIPSIEKLDGAPPPIPELCQSIAPTLLPPAQFSLQSEILRSTDKLFFMEYTPAGTMLRKWYLVQVDIDASTSLRQDYATAGVCSFSFLAKRPGDIKLSDKHSSWWLNWYRYSKESVTNEIVFGTRMFFRLSMLPYSTTYIRWNDELLLVGSNKILLGPFNFEHISPTNRNYLKVSLINWRILYDECKTRGLLPPIIGTTAFNASPFAPISRKTRKRKFSSRNV